MFKSGMDLIQISPAGLRQINPPRHSKMETACALKDHALTLDTFTEPQPFPFVGNEALRLPITAALRRVLDPEVGLSIVDVGLIYQVTAAEQRVHVLMTMTSAACPVADDIMDEIERRLDAVVPPEQRVELELCWEPPWSPDRITAEGRRQMGW